MSKGKPLGYERLPTFHGQANVDYRCPNCGENGRYKDKLPKYYMKCLTATEECAVKYYSVFRE